MNPEDAARRLVEWDLLTREAIVDGRLEMSGSARRNFNLRLDRGPDPGLFVKEPDPGLPEAVATVAAEARFYGFCDSEQKASAVRRLLPAILRVDGEAPLLVIELVAGSRSLWRECRDSSPGDVSSGWFEAVGNALGALHTTFRQPGLATDPRLGRLPKVPSFYLNLDRPRPHQLRYLSRGQLEVLEMAQSEPGITAGLERARAAWRVETLIHGDVRWENVLVVGRPRADAPIRLIDWELVQRGDPAWDIGGMLQEFVRFWLTGMSMRPDLETHRRLATARWPLETLRPAVRAFWAAYLEARRHDPGGTDDLLTRAIDYSAARLVLSAFEHHAEIDRASPLGVLLLQVSANIFADPERAAGAMYDLESPASR